MKPLESQAQVGDADAARACLSALADGRAEACDPALSAWTQDADARRTWHAYQLIGDVLRSDDLAAPAERDEAFLQQLRQRLAQEPTILAPQVLVQQPVRPNMRRPSLRWGAAAAVAGVSLVVGVVVTLNRADGEQQVAKSTPQVTPSNAVVKTLNPTAQPPVIARVNVGPTPVSVPPAAAEPDAPQWQMLDERVLRDARLETYLRAHRGSAAVGGRIEAVVLER
jgi:sigma-E factor negative regulatory protein RseA